jgi:hypothetical protein
MSTSALIVFAVVFVGVFAFQWYRMRSDPARRTEWEREMRATPWRDQWRISRAVRAGRRLDNPREARLAVGMVQEQRRMNGGGRRGPKVQLVIGTLLLLLGLLSGEATVIGLGAVFVAIGLVARMQERRLSRRLERAEELNRDQAALEATPPGQ